MEEESRFGGGTNESHADKRDQLLGIIRGRLLDGAYDVLANHHIDILEVVSGDRRYEHELTRAEAEQLERSVWSAGEDQELDLLVQRIERGIRTAGFNLQGDHLDLTVRTREIPE